MTNVNRDDTAIGKQLDALKIGKESAKLPTPATTTRAISKTTCSLPACSNDVKKKNTTVNIEKKEIKVKMLIQQCLSASLKISDLYGNPSKIEIGRGIVVYICFLKGCKEEIVKEAVTALLKVKLCETEAGGLGSIQDVDGDILIVPQATLGGKMKGTSVQYHSNIPKEEGLHFYEEFVKYLQNCRKNTVTHGKIRNGVYGERQILQMDTNGPFSHIFEV